MTILLLALATWRVSRMLVYESGPFYVFQRVRIWTKSTEIDCYHDGSNSVLCCIYCASVWVAIAFYLLSLTAWGYHILVVFAVSGGAMLLHELGRLLHGLRRQNADDETGH